MSKLFLNNLSTKFEYARLSSQSEEKISHNYLIYVYMLFAS